MQTDHENSSQHDDPMDAARLAQIEVEDAKARLASAADRIRTEARNAGSTLSSLVIDELDRRAGDLGTQLRSLAGRMRGETLDDDTSPAPEIVAQAAGLVEDLSHRLDGQSVRQIGQQLDRFGRENPALFVMGCLLTGAIAGRIIVASTDDRSTAESARSAFAGTADDRDRSGGTWSGAAGNWARDDRNDDMEDAFRMQGSAEDWTDTDDRDAGTGANDDLPLGRPTSDTPTGAWSEHGKNG